MMQIILDECVEEIRTRRASIGDCLARYPEYADELAPLLETAIALENLPDVRPSKAFKLKTRVKIAEWSAHPQARRRALLPRFSFARLAAILVVILGLTSGGAYAADSLPGSPLYPIKRGAEQVQLWSTADQESQARVYMMFAERRLAETKALTRQADSNALVEQTMTEYREAVAAVGSAAPTTSKPTSLTNELTDRLTRQQEDLKSLEKKVSDRELEKSLNAVDKVKDILKKN